MLSICTTVKNRSRIQVGEQTLTLFPNLIRSLRSALESTQQEAEVVVSDWQSDDWPLHEWINEKAGHVPVRIIETIGNFARGTGRNVAGHAAKGDTLIFLDADMLVSPVFLRRCEEVVASGKSFFPICYSFKDATNTRGWWRVTGKGNCALSRETFEQVVWPSSRPWGGEDLRFHNRVAEVSEVVREEVEGFHHQWHPTDRKFKDRYAV